MKTAVSGGTAPVTFTAIALLRQMSLCIVKWPLVPQHRRNGLVRKGKGSRGGGESGEVRSRSWHCQMVSRAKWERIGRLMTSGAAWRIWDYAVVVLVIFLFFNQVGRNKLAVLAKRRIIQWWRILYSSGRPENVDIIAELSLSYVQLASQ